MGLSTVLLLAATLQADAPVLDNPYVRVSRNTAPCASAQTPECVDRIIVALGNIDLNSVAGTRRMVRGDIAVFGATDSYLAPVGGPYFEVVLKPNRPAVKSPTENIPPEKNAIRHDADAFVIFEERLEPGDTRARHTHSQRVVIQLNKTTLQQWPEGEPEVMREMRVDQAAFNEPVIHVVKNVGGLPLRGIVIEFKPAR
ncbi:MAG: hypothetical protein H0T71_05980 [Acidobacteria bacterium]|nr:hypothetical protein [Acidobacteriota bacterium]